MVLLLIIPAKPVLGASVIVVAFYICAIWKPPRMFFLCGGDFLSRSFLGSWVAAALTNMPVPGIAIRWNSRVAQPSPITMNRSISRDKPAYPWHKQAHETTYMGVILNAL